MDFSIPPEPAELQHRPRAFIRDKIIPLEGDVRQERHGPTDELRRELSGTGVTGETIVKHGASR